MARKPQQTKTTSDPSPLTEVVVYAAPDGNSITTDPPGLEGMFHVAHGVVWPLSGHLPRRLSDGYMLSLRFARDDEAPAALPGVRIGRNRAGSSARAHAREDSDTAARRQRRHRGSTPEAGPAWTITDARKLAKMIPAATRSRMLAHHVLDALNRLHRGGHPDPITYLAGLIGNYQNWARGREPLALQNPSDWLSKVVDARLRKRKLPDSAQPPLGTPKAHRRSG